MSKKNEIITKKENYTFDHLFSQEELQLKSKQLSRACIERNQIEDEKKSTMSIFKSRIDGKNAEINMISEHISTGRETVFKTCDVEMNYERSLKVYYHEGIKVGEEKMKASDHQLQLSDSE